MPGVYELERMVVRLIGDGSSYRRMLSQAESDTARMTKAVTTHANRSQTIIEQNNLKLQQLQQKHAARIANMITSGAPYQQILNAENAHQMKINMMSQVAYLRSQQMARTHAMLLAEITADGARQAAEAARAGFDRMTMFATVAFTVVGGLALKTFAQFDQVMTKAESVFKATAYSVGGGGQAGGLGMLRGAALELSGKVIQSPRELAESYFFLAQAGKSAKQSMELLPVISKFATAGSLHMDKAADSLVGIQNAMNMVGKTPAEDAAQLQRISDVITVGSTQSLATIEQLVDALVNHAAPSLRAIGKDVEEGTALLAAYGDQLRRGKVAGSDLSRVIRLLGAPESTKKAKEGREKWGLHVFDDQGKMKKFSEIAANLEDILKPLSPELRLIALEQMGFEARIQHAVLPMIEMSKTIEDYENRMRDARGTTDKMAKDIESSFSNQWTMFTNRIKASAVVLGEMLVPAIKEMTRWVDQGMNSWNKLSDGTRRTLLLAAAIAALTGPAVLLVRTIIMLGGAVKAALVAGGSMLVWAEKLGLRWTHLVGIGIALAVFELGKALIDSTKYSQQLDRALNDNIKTFERLQAATGKTTDFQIQKILDIKDPNERSSALSKRLEQEQKNLVEYNKHVQKLKDKLDDGHSSFANFFSFGSLDKEQKVDQQLLSEAEARAQKTREIITRIQSEIAKVAPAEGAKIQVNELMDAIDTLNKKLKEEHDILGMSSDEAAVYNLRMKVMAETLDKFDFDSLINRAMLLHKLFLAEQMVGDIELTKKYNQELTQQSNAIKELSKSLKEQVATFGMSSVEAQIYKIETESARFVLSDVTKEHLKRAKALALELHSLEEVHKTMEKAKSVTEQFLPPSIKFGTIQAQLTTLWMSGAISLYIYTAALADAAKEMGNIDKAHKSFNQTINQTTVGSAEAATRMQKYLETIGMGDIRNPRRAAARAMNNAGQGLWPGNRLGPAPGMIMDNGIPREAILPRAPGQRGRQRFDEPRQLWETAGAPFEQGNKILTDIRDILANMNGRDTIEVETADIG